MTNIPTHHSADYPKKKKKKTYLHNTATHFEYKIRKESAAARESKCIFLVKTQGLFGWKNEKVGGQEIESGWKSGKIEEILISIICIWLERLKSRGMKNFFIWLRKK